MTDQMSASEYLETAKKKQPPKAFTNFDSFLRRGEFGRIECEFRFHPTRRWRFDWAFIDRKIAFEYDGLTAPTMKQRKGGESNVGHASIGAILRDSEKINEAQLLGWKVFRVNAKSIGDGTAYTVARQALS